MVGAGAAEGLRRIPQCSSAHLPAAMRSTLRTFIAIEISADVREQAGRLVGRLERSDANIKWVALKNLHLTLKFLGDVPTNETLEVCRAVERAVRGLAPFHVQLGGAGAFPSAARPRAVWIGVTEGADEMIRLHDALDKELSGLGYPAEQRKFRPHLTIGRARRGRGGGNDLPDLLEKNKDFPSGAMPVREVVVFSSQLESSGPVYTPLGRARLKGK